MVFWAFVTGAVAIVSGVRLREAIAETVLPLSMGAISLLLGIFEHGQETDRQFAPFN